VTVSGPGEGERLENETRVLLIKAATPELSFFEVDAGPDFEGVGLHYHKLHADSFYVLEGELEFTVDGETIRAPAGTAVVVPPGVVHAFSKPGTARARYLNIHAPDAGFADVMRARNRGEEPDPRDGDMWDVE
jgi:mannose-6-phosphate isomerase-like protein (cupin superfamily)